MYVIHAQSLKTDNYVSSDNVSILDFNDECIDLNAQIPINDNIKKYRFDYPILVSNNTNLVFSVYDCNQTNKVKCAFLGGFTSGQNDKSFKVSSCDAKTRYEFDSHSPDELSLLNCTEDSDYIDEQFNSYDSMDKYVFVVDFEPSIDSSTMFNMSVKNGISTYSYNILGDSGYIPHFAYQSLVKFSGNDSGTSYTWMNKHLKDKEHLSFELLGMDDKNLPNLYDTMSKMVVEDLTDKCFTLINPTRMAEDIYRIWCGSIDRQDKYG